MSDDVIRAIAKGHSLCMSVCHTVCLSVRPSACYTRDRRPSGSRHRNEFHAYDTAMFLIYWRLISYVNLGLHSEKVC